MVGLQPKFRELRPRAFDPASGLEPEAPRVGRREAPPSPAGVTAAGARPLSGTHGQDETMTERRQLGPETESVWAGDGVGDRLASGADAVTCLLQAPSCCRRDTGVPV